LVCTPATPMLRNLIFFGLPVLAAAQTPGPRMSPPSLGYLFDENAKAIRRISGIPGAAGLDQPVSPGGSLDSALVLSRAHLAIVNTKEGRLALVDWNVEPRQIELDSALTRATLLAASRSADRIAISDGASIEVWSSLRATPSRTASFSHPDGILSLAVGADDALVAVTRAGTLLLAGNEPRTISTGIGALAFHPNGTDVV